MENFIDKLTQTFIELQNQTQYTRLLVSPELHNKIVEEVECINIDYNAPIIKRFEGLELIVDPTLGPEDFKFE